ncbi:hypothetical protein Sinac_2933 [Singulisphaera acidiphila DSM 18658]|uniref:Uncharacterized protein n=1 Tax=Singulisphaera acidiphila (strain ATCC BAA-1392 / DSM 18658 / VKM B-2454 / MOB10) TaxID=886293 RepID=L0DCX0_SINAD|nr:hypothetical protein Sinac_2933 [Singulisphaera acidiphila DSM 18658]
MLLILRSWFGILRRFLIPRARHEEQDNQKSRRPQSSGRNPKNRRLIVSVKTGRKRSIPDCLGLGLASDFRSTCQSVRDIAPVIFNYRQRVEPLTRIPRQPRGFRRNCGRNPVHIRERNRRVAARVFKAAGEGRGLPRMTSGGHRCLAPEGKSQVVSARARELCLSLALNVGCPLAFQWQGIAGGVFAVPKGRGLGLIELSPARAEAACLSLCDPGCQ